MTKILFICHGNICRSPMAEFIFKTIIAEAGLPALRKFGMGSAIRFIRLQSKNLMNMVFHAKERGLDR